VYCVHLVNSLGYDLLFQDLDLVWYKDPIQYFLKHKDMAKFDMFFQYDGDHHPIRFAPWAANTGFYFVKHNQRTAHFFDVFVRMGDYILFDKSHQAAFSTLANEHASLHGLRVKVLAEDHEKFLCKWLLPFTKRVWRHSSDAPP
jgi:Nucleotide-diphospho-sugar transferase